MVLEVVVMVLSVVRYFEKIIEIIEGDFDVGPFALECENLIIVCDDCAIVIEILLQEIVLQRRGIFLLFND